VRGARAGAAAVRAAATRRNIVVLRWAIISYYSSEILRVNRRGRRGTRRQTIKEVFNNDKQSSL
jgi:hypothetical protein